MTKILRLMARLDDSWQGDLIGAVLFFALAYGLYVFGWAVGL